MVLPMLCTAGMTPLESDVGFAVVALFVAVWAGAVAYWKLGGVERRWALPEPRPVGAEQD